MQPDRKLQLFVRALVRGAVATRRGAAFAIEGGPSAPADAVNALVRSGALDGAGDTSRANGNTRAWLKRAMLDDDAFAAQHRVEVAVADGARLNLAESPLARLAAGPAPFLEPHQVEAGERFRRLFTRAQMLPKVTMTYSAAATAGSRGAPGEISDMAADARRSLTELYRTLPADCAGVLTDVCGHLKGLQAVESERGWPRRSAKLVLRIGLEQLARHFGLSATATGEPSRGPRTWMGEGARPDRFG